MARRQPADPRCWAWAALPLLALLWIAAASRLPSYLLPQPWDVAAEAARWWHDGGLWRQVGRSAWRAVAGFGVATLAALALGVATALDSRLREFMSPLNSLFMAIPPLAWTPLTILAFGLGDASIICVVVIAATFPMTLTVQAGVRSIQGGDIRAARSLGARPGQLLRHVYLPASLPFVTAAMRLGFAQAWRALVSAEMVGAPQGIGWMVATGGQIGNTSQVLLGIVLIGLIAWLTERLVFRRLQSRYDHWLNT